MIKKATLIVLFITASFSANAQNWWGNSKKIKGNGNVVTVKRTTSNYDGIAVGGSFDVILIKGKEGAITIEGEENIIPLIETEVSGNTLQIKYQKNYKRRYYKKQRFIGFFRWFWKHYFTCRC